jgi:hypothetical protein
MGAEKNRRPKASTTVIITIANSPAALNAPSTLNGKDARFSRKRATVPIEGKTINLA